jgi:hypothetical protein
VSARLLVPLMFPLAHCRLAVRVRPPLQTSDPGYDLIPQRFRTPTCDVSSATNLAIQSTQGKKLFVFDRVFGEETTQQGVWEYVSGSVDSFIQGYNVSILAYGQSGAGKSYTMGTAGNEGAFDPVHAGESHGSLLYACNILI